MVDIKSPSFTGTYETLTLPVRFRGPSMHDRKKTPRVRQSHLEAKASVSGKGGGLCERVQV